MPIHLPAHAFTIMRMSPSMPKGGCPWPSLNCPPLSERQGCAFYWEGTCPSLVLIALCHPGPTAVTQAPLYWGPKSPQVQARSRGPSRNRCHVLPSILAFPSSLQCPSQDTKTHPVQTQTSALVNVHTRRHMPREVSHPPATSTAKLWASDQT